MTIQEAAKIYRISVRRLQKQCKAGIHSAKKVKGSWEISRPFTEEQTVEIRVIADALGVSSSRVRCLCREGRVQAYKIGSAWRVGIKEATKVMLARLV